MKTLLAKFGVLFITFWNVHTAFAAVDSTYIKRLDYFAGVRIYPEQRFLFLSYEDQDGNESLYLPNTPITPGIDISYRDFIIGLDLGYGIPYLSKEKYGKTKSFDIQLHHYDRRFVIDTYFQYYRGFYKKNGSKIELRPDIKMTRYSLMGLYIFNSSKYSFMAAFGQKERQVKSAGSFLLGLEYYRTLIKAELPLNKDGYRRSNNHIFGVNLGYAYTFAFAKYWNIGVVVVGGIGVGNQPFEEIEDKEITLFPTMDPRLTCIYDRESFGISLSYIGNMAFFASDADETFRVHSGSIRLSFIKRFQA